MTLSLRCISCPKEYPVDEIRYLCDCGGLLDVWHDLETLRTQVSPRLFDDRVSGAPTPKIEPATHSGVWRYHEIVLPVSETDIVSRREGNTALYSHPQLSAYVGVDGFHAKHEGENPTGSFKDRGMTVGTTQASLMNVAAVACASTGNTSASMAAYAATANLPALVFIPEGRIAPGKLAQALAYGAKTLQIQGDFDDAMQLVQEVATKLDIYLLNSLNPFRLEGQKSIAYELLQGFNWSPPDWIVLPAGNLGNTAAIGKALYEAKQLGLIDRIPRVAAIQAAGANPFYQGYQHQFKERITVKAKTVASAISIGSPISYSRAIRALQWTNGLVEQVTDNEILEAKAMVDRVGIGCEPASAASVAGTRKLVTQGVIKPEETVVSILTGHLLKDSDTTVAYHTGKWPNSQYANKPIQVAAEFDAVRSAIEAVL